MHDSMFINVFPPFYLFFLFQTYQSRSNFLVFYKGGGDYLNSTLDQIGCKISYTRDFIFFS